MSTAFPSTFWRFALALVAVLTAFVGAASTAGASEAGTTAEPTAGSAAEHKAEDFDIEFLGAAADGATSVFRYELTYHGVDDPESTDEDRLSHLAVAGFCVTPLDVDPHFTPGEGAKWDSEILAAAGQVYEITFPNDAIANALDGSPLTTGTSTWTLKKGSGEGSEVTVTSNGPACAADEVAATPAFTCPGETVPMTDVDGDGTIGQTDCDYVPPFSCPGETVPVTDVNDDGTVDIDDCDDGTSPPVVIPTVVECPTGTMPPAGETGTDADGDGDADNCGAVLSEEEELAPAPETPETPETPVIPVTAPVDVVEDAVAGPTLQETAVLPSMQVRSAPVAKAPAAVAPAALARTGTDGTVSLTAVGLALVLAGAALRRRSNRVAAVR